LAVQQLQKLSNGQSTGRKVGGKYAEAGDKFTTVLSRDTGQIGDGPDR